MKTILMLAGALMLGACADMNTYPNANTNTYPNSVSNSSARA